MTGPSEAQPFYTFHSNTTAVPAEITLQILNYIVADARPLPLGGGVITRSAHHPVASVSRTFRSIYLSHPYSISTKSKVTTPVKVSIGEVLEFSGLRTIASFFEDGPGQDAKTLLSVRFLNISYLDNDSATGWGRWTTNYAYEAFEHLCRRWDLMQVSCLRLCLSYVQAISSVDDPGLWSLLKLRNIPHLIILGPYGCIAPNIRKCLRTRTRKRKLFPWRPLGLENAGGKAWTDTVKHQGQAKWQQQYGLLDSRYKYLHGRKTVAERRKNQRIAYHKRRRRWPMLSKGRKRRLRRNVSTQLTAA
ncbi:hypothetical protein B0O99DRAFT_393006 [Bisporella sp. PMI_857]|nr:hypothetical protein B0O99DRAFT_393006 [Bisporella sp. PMI_857]